MSVIRRIRDRFRHRLYGRIPFAAQRLLPGRRWRLPGVVLYLLIILLVALDHSRTADLPRVNEVALYDILSPVELEIIDKTQTELMKREAERNITPVYRYQPDTYQRIIDSTTETFKLLTRLSRPTSEIRLSTVREALSQAEIPSLEADISLDDLSAKMFSAVTAGDTGEIDRASGFLCDLFRSTLSDARDRQPGMDYPGIKPQDIGEVKDLTYQKIRRGEFTPAMREFIAALFYHYARATYVIDHAEMRRKQENIRSRIQPIKRKFLKGEVIVRHGEIIKPQHIEIFERLNLYEETQRPWSRFLGAFLLATLTLGLLLRYQWQMSSGNIQGRFFNLLALLILLALGLAKVGRFLILSDATVTILNNSIHLFSPFVVPVVASTLLIALLIDSQLALFVNTLLAVLVHIVLHLRGMEFLFATVVSGSMAVLAVQNAHLRRDLTRAGAVISVGNVMIITAAYFMEGSLFNPNFYGFLVRDITWGFLNGFFCTVVAVGLLPYLESIFRISTSIRLLELSDLNQPLMRRLLLEAPGTYHHSILVGTLAEAAAKEVGADAILCRVGAYYHDIGKLRRPLFFVENQVGEENVHDSIKPNLSALVIMSHCKDGAEIGGEYNLPQEILDIILQHHGSNLLTYFYFKSRNDREFNDESGRQQSFRYPGPKPQSREAAIVFLADAVEAATRSISRPTPASLKGMIKKICNERFNDGQFDDCELTLRDMERINLMFVKTILGVFHSRIEYPGNDRGRVRRSGSR